MSWSWLRRTLALLVVCLPSCTYMSGDGSVLVTSTPAGARIFLDGEDTGETTPTTLDMTTVFNAGGMLGSDRIVTIRKKGFEPEQRVLHQHTAFYTSKWVDGATNFWFATFPLFWTFGDFFLPFAGHWTYVPHEVHVRLYPEGEAPGHGF